GAVCTSNRACIELESVCNGFADCSDASDESPLRTGCAWTCDPDFYDDGQFCDCGCGIQDPDCADSTASSCAFCETGSCGTDGASSCLTNIAPNQNWACHGPGCFFCGDATLGDYCILPSWECDAYLDCTEEMNDEHPTNTACEWLCDSS